MVDSLRLLGWLLFRPSAWRAVGTFERPSVEALAAAISAVVGAPTALAC